MFPKTASKQSSRVKKAQSCSTLWFDECYDDYYNSADNVDELKCDDISAVVSQFHRKDEHKIRIEIKYDEDDIIYPQIASSAHHQNGNPNVNGLPTSCHEYSDNKLFAAAVKLCDENINKPPRGNALNDVPPKLIKRKTTQRPYVEKAIDVPEGFEELAYAQLKAFNRGPLRRKICLPTRQLNPIVNEFVEVSAARLL